MSSPKRRSGFTLIELLTVIAIIAILMGLLFPAMNAVKESARKTQAKNDITQIVTAVKAFYTEYGKYPTPSAYGGNSDTIFGDSNNSGTNKSFQLFSILRNITSQSTEVVLQNPRGIVFFEGNAVKDATAPKAGFDSLGNFYDPWGKTYSVAVDLSYDNVTQTFIAQYTDLASSYTPEPQSNKPGIPTGAVAFSFGKDGKQGKNGDNKYSGSDDIIS